jgi:hypothetical protein
MRPPWAGYSSAWALVVNYLHRQGEVTHDLTKIHGSKTRVLGQALEPMD